MKYDENVNVFLRINKAAITCRFVWYVTLFLQEQKSNLSFIFLTCDCRFYIRIIFSINVFNDYALDILIVPMYDCTWMHKPPVTSLKSILFQKLFWPSALNLQNSINRTFFSERVRIFFSKQMNNSQILKHVTCYFNSKPEKKSFF